MSSISSSYAFGDVANELFTSEDELQDRQPYYGESPFCRIGESLYRRGTPKSGLSMSTLLMGCDVEITCDAGCQTTDVQPPMQKASSSSPDRLNVIALGLAVAIIASVAATMTYQYHHSQELERKILLQSSRIRELEAKVESFHNYRPFFDIPEPVQKKPSIDSCWVKVGLGVCTEELLDKLEQSIEVIAGDLNNVTGSTINMLERFMADWFSR